MLTSRLPQSTCGFTSSRRPASAAASLTSPSAAGSLATPAGTGPSQSLASCSPAGRHLTGSSTNSPSSVNCVSNDLPVYRHVRRASPSCSPTTERQISSLSTFQPARSVDAPSRRLPLPPSHQVLPVLSTCCNDCRRTSESSSFPPPPPPLPMSFVTSVRCVSSSSLCVSHAPHEPSSCRVSSIQPPVRHDTSSDNFDGHVESPGPPPPPQLVPGLVSPPPAPPLPILGHCRPSTTSTVSLSVSPGGRTPRTKLRRLQWNKIPDSRVRAVGSGSIWAHVQHQLKADSTSQRSVDLERVEELFAVGNLLTTGEHGVLRSRPGSAVTTQERKKYEQVELFDSRRSLNMGIFLRQFRPSSGYNELVKHLSTADSESIGAERLRGLLKSLPDDEEMSKVLSYSGDLIRLGPAEKFCRDLAEALPNYRLRIEALLMKEEFNQAIDWLKPSIDAVIISARGLRDCRAIQDILCTVLLVGNFLNTGTYTGGAAGFQLQSLLSLRDLRANGGKSSLLHFIVTEVEKRNPGVIAEIRNLKYLKEATQCHTETILGDIAALRDKLQRISHQISSTDVVFQQQMETFIEFAGDELSELENDVTELESLRLQLAAYFCEDEKTFQLDDCIRHFSTFFDSFIRATQENQERHLLEEKAEERRRLRTQQMNAKQHLRHRAGEKKSKDTATDDASCAARRHEDIATSAPTTTHGSGNQRDTICHNVSTSDLGGYADVTGGSATLPLRSISSSGALYTRMHSQPTTAENNGDDDATSEGDLLDCLLRTASTVPGGAGSTGDCLGPRRKRRSNGTENVRERTSSPVCPSVNRDLSQITASRRRSLPTPRLVARDLSAPSLIVTSVTGCDDDSVQFTASGKPQTAHDAASVSLTCSAKDDRRLSEIDENSTTSVAVPGVTWITSSPESEGDERSVGVGVPHDDSRAAEQVDVAPALTSMSSDVDESSKSSVLRQTWQSTDGVDVDESASSPWLPRRCQSLRLYRVHARSAARGEAECQKLEANVHEFHSRAAPEREALRNRLRKLSLIYASSTDSDETSRTWPASRRHGVDGASDVPPPPASIASSGRGDVSSSSSTSTLQLKYDTDSLCSQKDEGFETASISSDVCLSSSQRSSVCDCDSSLMATVTTTLERRTDSTADETGSPPETFPPPPPTILSIGTPEVVETDAPSCNNENCLSRSVDSMVSPMAKQESVNVAAECLPLSDRPSPAVNTVSGIRTSNNKPDSNRRNAKTVAAVRRGPQATTTANKPTPATPRRTSSLLCGSTSHSVSSTSSGTSTGNRKTASRPLTGAHHSTVGVSSTPTPSRLVQRAAPLHKVSGEHKMTSAGLSAATAAMSSTFVRRSETRATIAAPLLRTNKRIAAETRKMKAGTAAVNVNASSINQTASTSSFASNVVSVPQQKIRSRTTSSSSNSSRTSTTTGPKSVSSRPVSSASKAASRQPATGVNVPCASSKKPEAANDAVCSSSSLKMPSTIRHSMLNSRLRAPMVATRKHC